MTITRRTALAGGSLLASASIFHNIPFAAAQPVDAGGAPEPATGPLDTAIEAYVYGYPLVTMEMTRRVLTNVEKPEGLAAPMGQFVNLREYPNAAFKRVTAPNADTLYSSSFIDVSKEPFILQVPDEHGRYYLVPMYEAWTNKGTRRSGVKIAPIDRLRSDVLATFQPWVRFSASTGARRRERVHLVGCTPSPALSLCRCLPAVKAR
jgi:hypothetical protein